MHFDAIGEIACLADIILIQAMAINDVTVMNHNGMPILVIGIKISWAQQGTILRPPDYESVPIAIGITS